MERKDGIIMKGKWKTFAFYIAVSLLAGGLSSFFVRDGMMQYENLVQPPLSPPGWLFPVVWGILYVLMGISAAMVSFCGGKEKGYLRIFWVQLLVNFFWSIFFFGQQRYFFAFIWLLLLLVLIGRMIWNFWKVCPKAALLQIPYFLWVLFAGYLNLGIALLNP